MQSKTIALVLIACTAMQPISLDAPKSKLQCAADALYNTMQDNRHILNVNESLIQYREQKIHHTDTTAHEKAPITSIASR